jgi:hypothetical protein
MRPALHCWRSGFFGGLLLLLATAAFAELPAPPVRWSYFLGDKDGTSAPKLASAADGGFYLYTQGTRPLIKFSAGFEIAWEIRRVPGSNDIERVSALATLPQGEILALISTTAGIAQAKLFGNSALPDHQYLAKLTTAGDPIWLREISGATITSLAAANDGAFVLAGFGSGIVRIGGDEINLGTGAYFFARFNEALVNVAVGAASPISLNYLWSIQTNQSGGFDVSGNAAGSSWSLDGTTLPGPGVFVANLNATGSVVSARLIATNASFMTATRGLVAWRSSGGSSFVSKFAEDGSLVWQKPVSGQVSAVASGNPVLVAGTETLSLNWFLAALNENGETQWRLSEPGRGWTAAKEILTLADGQVLVTGEMSPAGAFFGEYFLQGFSLRETAGSSVFLVALNLEKPSFRVQPNSQQGIAGGQVVLRAEVYSPAPVSLKWFKKGVELSLQTNAELRLTNLQNSNAGDYTLAASNANGTTISTVAHVSVNSIQVTTIASGLSAPRNPVGLPDSRILLTENGNSHVRVITGGGVTNFPISSFAPTALALQLYSTAGPNILLADGGSNSLRLVQLAHNSLEPITSPGIQPATPFAKPNSVATADGLDFFTVSETNGTRIWKYQDGDVEVIAGAEAGFVNGPMEAARFREISSVAMDLRGNIYVADRGNHAVRKINVNGTVSTLAEINRPSGLVVDESGNVFVTDNGDSSVIRISSYGDITTLAGAAEFNAPEGITILLDGSLAIADTGNNRVRRLTFAPLTAVETRLAISRASGLTITVTGSATTYQIDSATRLGVDADWGFEAVVNVGIPQILPVPDQTRFYRASPLD